MMKTYKGHKFMVEESAGAYDIFLVTLTGNQYIDYTIYEDEIENIIYDYVEED